MAFPVGAVYSIVAEMMNGMTVETGLIGRDGFVGIPVFLGAAQSPLLAVCQVPNGSLVLPAEDLAPALAESPALRREMGLYVNFFLSQAGRSAACNRLHPVEQRAARWFLMVADRSSARFPITHDFLGTMLGVHRPSVSVAAELLEEAGAIRYSRGQVDIVDRAALERHACECYAVLRDQLDGAGGGQPQGPPR